MSRPQKKPMLALDSNIVADNLPIEIIPKLYIGSIHAAFNQDAMRELKITHVSRIIFLVSGLVPALCGLV